MTTCWSPPLWVCFGDREVRTTFEGDKIRFQRPITFEVHGRAGEPCPRCGAALLRVSYESYEVVYCAPCQTGSRMLADRRMSKLLK